MTVVEFYDRVPLENVAAVLGLEPEKVLFVGEEKVLKSFAPSFAAFARERGLNIKAEYYTMPGQSLELRVRALALIIEREEECLFDLTGGDDLTLVAMGILLERYRDRKPGLCRRQRDTGLLTDGAGDLLTREVPRLSIAQSVLLHGGAVRQEKEEYGTHSWVLDGTFTAAVDKLWELCRRSPRDWNRRMANLAHVSRREPEGLRVTAELDKLEKTERRALLSFLRELEKGGLISELREKGGQAAFAYADEQIRRCMEKAGTVLELKVLTAAKALEQPDGTAFYNDAACGVWIDWDGVCHRRGEERKDTENEIDVILMRDMTPIFLSCKNGAVGDGELYKLRTVTRRFGGEQARAALLTTDTGKDDLSAAYLRQRAEDMGVLLVENVHRMNGEQLQKALRGLAEG